MPRPSQSRPSVRSSSRRRAGGGTLLGVFIGLVLGIALAAAVGLYVTGGWKVYQSQLSGSRDARDVRDASKTGKAESDKPRFDFYKILPGGEEPKVAPPPKPVSPDRSLAAEAQSGNRPAPAPAPAPAAPKAEEKVATVDPAAKAPERFWLQAGSFANEVDADNLKARLALAGWEAQVQRGTLPDKGVRHRVRLGPYDNVDELNRIKGELARRGFDVAVIRY